MSLLKSSLIKYPGQAHNAIFIHETQLSLGFIKKRKHIKIRNANEIDALFEPAAKEESADNRTQCCHAESARRARTGVKASHRSAPAISGAPTMQINIQRAFKPHVNKHTVRLAVSVMRGSKTTK